MRSDAGTRLMAGLSMSPLLAVTVLLVAGAIRHDTPMLETSAVPLLEVLVPLALIVLSRSGKGAAPRLVHLAILTPCFLAPLALLYPWAIVPSHLPGVGFGGFDFFVTWLTKYPSHGPVNLSVLLGIVCVVGCAVVPVAFGLHHLLVRPVERGGLALWTLAFVVVYVPVAVRLDALTWLVGLGRSELVFTPPRYLVFGPLVRTLPLVVMVILVSLHPYVHRTVSGSATAGGTALRS